MRATLRQKKDGSWEIQFYESGVRKFISVGKKVAKKTVSEMLEVVKTLLYYKVSGITTPDKKTAGWIASAPSGLLDKLVKAGLVNRPESHTAGELWTAFRAAKTGIKDATGETYDHAQRRFFLFFDPDDKIESMKPAQMEQWKTFLRTQAPRDQSSKRAGNCVPGLAESTVAGTLTKMKAVFNWGVRQGWLDKSPLDGVGRGSFVNRENDRFITMDEYRRLLDACPCQEWRCILALSRVGGLRAPSEVLRVRWEDVNFEKRRLYIDSTKTGKRRIPLWDDLRIELERLFFNLAGTPATVENVITRYRDPERTNLGTQFARIVRIAGVAEIKRPFDNMRASRSTEVYASDGPFLESLWIGH